MQKAHREIDLCELCGFITLCTLWLKIVFKVHQGKFSQDLEYYWDQKRV
jgi:hypothetical protein